MTEETIFTAALAKSDPAERAAYLEDACGGDAALRRRVEALLHAHEQPSGPLDEPAGVGALAATAAEAQAEAPVGEATTQAATTAPIGQQSDQPATIDRDDHHRTTTDEHHAWPITEGPGSRIGPYKLLQQIGSGGMGLVFLAEQERPVRRRVALKIIKPGMDSAQVIARFEAERQALALMDHPHIAKVFDAGTTDTGRPYFVMELVQGTPITQYCDQARLSPRERLELFVPVCQAIQHAHQKGIIHRDIKPSNVLVTLIDGTPMPKIIDFGIAKATQQRLTERTLFTQLGVIVGTPEYMSPEQANLDSQDIDTRSDIYSLGVLLYELLTGTTPLRRETLRQAGFAELLRRIREEEPPTPSSRLSTTIESLPSIAAVRRTDPGRLSRLVRGELDWIVMKALEKDRRRRYETANGLARDIERYLNDEPVEAGPPSRRYRLRKFARKHRSLLATAGLIAAVLLMATGVSAWMAFRATRAEAATARALTQEARQRQQAEASEAKALAERDRADQEADNARRSAAEARRSEEDAQAVLEFFQNRVLAAARPAGQGGGLGRDATIRAAVEAAEVGLSEAFAERPRVEGAIRNTLGHTYLFLGESQRAIEHLERASDLRRTALGVDHPDTLHSLDDLAIAYHAAGRLDEAIRLHEDVWRRLEVALGVDHSSTLGSLNNLAMVYRAAGRHDEALPLLEDVRRRLEAALGTDHLSTLTSLNNLALAYRATGRHDEALPLFEDVRRRLEAALGPDHPTTLTSLNNLALAYHDAGRIDEALPLHEDVRRRMEVVLGPDHPDTLQSLHNLAGVYHSAGRHGEALPLFEDVRRRREMVLGPDHPTTLTSLNTLINLYTTLDRPAEAEPLLRELLNAERATLPAEDPSPEAQSQLAGVLAQLGMNLLQQEKHAEAEPLLRECLALREQALPEDWSRFNTMSRLGGALLGQGQHAEAEPLLLDGYKGLKVREETIPEPLRATRLAEAVERLVQLYEARDQPEQAESWRETLDSLTIKPPEATPPGP